MSSTYPNAKGTLTFSDDGKYVTGDPKLAHEFLDFVVSMRSLSYHIFMTRKAVAHKGGAS